jgi:hypothetical protein
MPRPAFFDACRENPHFAGLDGRAIYRPCLPQSPALDNIPICVPLRDLPASSPRQRSHGRQGPPVQPRASGCENRSASTKTSSSRPGCRHRRRHTNARILAGIATPGGGFEYPSAVEYLAASSAREKTRKSSPSSSSPRGFYFRLGNYYNALLSYLPFVVFYPTSTTTNRSRAAALACYAELKEWEPLYRSIQEIQKNYPASPAAKTAAEFLEKYKQELIDAGQFVDAAKVTSADAPVAPQAATEETKAE